MRLYACLLLFLAAAPALAQAPAPAEPTSGAAIRRLRAARAAGEIQLDGRLDEAGWAAAEQAGRFVQNFPNPGAPATESTEVRVLYTTDAIYVGARMVDKPDSIAAQLGRRDATGIYSDWFHVMIDSYHDRRTAFRFSVNPKGIQKDVFTFDDGSEDTSWDAVWEAAARIDEQGWIAEIRIPLSQLRFSSAAGASVWGLEFGRDVARRNERTYWAPILPNTPGFVSQFGELTGIEGLAAPRRLEVLPYSVARVTRAPEPAPAGQLRSPFHRANETAGSVGADLKYGLTSDLTLTATINPDFGQVEADPSVVNLSAFETFYPEKRPFFIEGANLFSFEIDNDDGSTEALFYSRRIGRPPQRGVFEPGGFVDSPDVTTIAGAGKISGRTRGGWSIGFFDALTSAEHAGIVNAAGARREEAIEAMTNYAVGTVKKDWNRGRSAVGGLFTATNRQLDDPSLEFLRSAAYSGGLSGRHRFGNGNYEVNGWVAGSHVLGSRESIALAQRSPARYFQRPDADHVAFDSTRTSLSGYTANFILSRIGGEHFRGGFGGHARSPGLEVNDAGFMGNTDNRMVFGWANYNQYKPGKLFRRWSVGLNPSASWDFGGERLHTQLNVFGNGELNSQWSAFFWSSRAFSSTSTSALRGGPAIRRPGAYRWNLGLNTDRRKPVSFQPGMFGSVEDDTDGRQLSFWTYLQVRPSGRMELSLNPQVNFNNSAWQYVTQRGSRYVFGELDQVTTSLTGRLTYAFTPALSLQLYAAPFISAGDYVAFKEVADPRAGRFADRFHSFQPGAELAYDEGRRLYAVDSDRDGAADFTFGQPDFSFKELRSNLVLRWEYRPGSAVFLVWSQGRTDFQPDGSFEFGRDAGRLFDAAGTNVLLVKLNYWLDF